MKTILVLTRPQISENVGMCARAMNAFGVENLRLVAPECAVDEASTAYRTASASRHILDRATPFLSLQEALADVHIALAFSRRPHDFPRPLWQLPELGEHQERFGGQTIALVFGPEDAGLRNEEKKLCHAIVSIPLAQETMSLNLAQAVSVVLYQWTRTPPAEKRPAPLVPHEEQERVLNLAIEILEHTRYFKEGRAPRQKEWLRDLVQRMAITTGERSSVLGALQGVRQALGIGESEVDRLK